MNTKGERRKKPKPNEDHLPYQCTVQSTLGVHAVRKTVSIFHYEKEKAIASFIYCLVKSTILSRIRHCSFCTTLCQLVEKKASEAEVGKTRKWAAFELFKRKIAGSCKEGSIPSMFVFIFFVVEIINENSHLCLALFRNRLGSNGGNDTPNSPFYLTENYFNEIHFTLSLVD